MKEIKAIIRIHRLDEVLHALHTHPELPGVTVSHVRGFGHTVGRTKALSETRIQYGTVEMVKLECVVNDNMADSVVELIQAAAHTGNSGDGKICLYDVREIVRIRTGDRTTSI
ncbi:MAG: P-II family nitrogen regulator [Phycisphaerae bacterium]